MKKFLSIIFTVTVLLTVAIVAIAADAPQTDSSDSYTLYARANDMTYYENGYGAIPGRYQCTVNTAENGYAQWFDIAYGDAIVEEWPTQVGTYTVTFDKTTAIENDPTNTEYTFNLSMNITVLELPQLSGKCGDDMTWSFDTENDTLTISGTGDMYTIAETNEDYWNGQYGYEPGWWKLPVKHVIVEEGVESLSNYSFFQEWNGYYRIHETLELPTTLKSIPEQGFICSTAITELVIPEGITSLTGWPFGSPGNSFTALTELHLPSTLTTMDITTIILSGLSNKTASRTLETIYYAGTEDEWNAIERVDSEYMKELFGDDYAGFYENWCVPARDIFENINVIFEETEETPTPTSGTLGETVSWKYNEKTNTMILSGTGTAFADDANEWADIYLELLPEHVIVKEGIEYLFEGIFHYSPHLKDISLPSTLKDIPNALVGFNGPTDGTDYEKEYGDVPGMTSIIIPEGITSLTKSSFYLCWGINEYYLPSTLKEIDLDTICAPAHLRSSMELESADTVIHFAGTEEQWNEIKHIVGSTRENYGTGLSDAQLEELFATFTVEFGSTKTITPIENAVKGSEMEIVTMDTVGEIVVVPTIIGIMTIEELKETLNEDNVTVIAPNGIIGTGSKIVIDGQETEIAVKGDVDGDGKITVFDSMMVRKALENNGFNNEALREFAGDVDGSAGTTVSDASSMLSHTLNN